MNLPACTASAAGPSRGFEAGARGVGTTITVKNLFYNTPARMKFLKKDTSEGNYVSDVVSELALAHPEVAFRFVREGRVQFQTPGDGQLLGAAYAVLGREFSKDLLEVDGGAGPLPRCRPHHAAPGMPCLACHAVLFCKRALCEKPHHDGRAGSCLQGYPDAGQIPLVRAFALHAGAACGCERASGQNGSSLCTGKGCF